MTHNERTGPARNLEDIERLQRRRAEEEDEGVNYDDEMDQKRALDDAMLGREQEGMPSERDTERDTPEARGSSAVDDKVRGEKRRRQYDDGADVVSELD